MHRTKIGHIIFYVYTTCTVKLDLHVDHMSKLSKCNTHSVVVYVTARVLGMLMSKKRDGS